MRSKKRLWEQERDDDPTTGLINLFDVWIVVVVALMMTLLGSVSRNQAAQANMAESDQDADVSAMDLQKEVAKLERIQKTEANKSGQGVLLGRAYRLESGEIVYVPEDR